MAQQLAQRSQTEFYVERLQPDWLSRDTNRYRLLVLRSIYGIEAIIVAALFAWIRGGKVGNAFGVGAGLFGQLGAGPGNKIFAWMAPGIGGGVEGGGSLGVLIALVFSLLTLLIGSPSFPTISLQACWYGLMQGLISGGKAGGIVSMLCSLIFSVLGGISYGLTYGVGMGLFSGLLVGLLSGLIAGLRYDPSRPQGQRRTCTERLVNGLIIGLCAGVSFALVDGLLHIAMQSVVVYGLIAGLFSCVAFGFGGGTNLLDGLGTEIKPAESVSWSWRNVGQCLRENLIKGMLVGLLVMVCVSIVISCASGLFYGMEYGMRYGLIYGLIIGLITSVASILAGILRSGWSSDQLAEHQLLRPNEGIRRSMVNAIIAACLFGPLGGIASGVVCGAAFGLVGMLDGWLILGEGFGLVFGLLFALQSFMIHGGTAWIEHYMLRWRLWRAGYTPANYVAFLDYAAERILLRKVGGGYIFAHRLLQDYFASLGISSEDEEAS
ncbi:MAG: hypothetical protein J2P36_34665 [Ktedonobacteraceae bacterium]|nr:hypothetical protein [Ktedonobacteraceae bacterium]